MTTEGTDYEWLERITRRAIDEHVQPLIVFLEGMRVFPWQTRRRMTGHLHSVLNTLIAVNDEARRRRS